MLCKIAVGVSKEKAQNNLDIMLNKLKISKEAIITQGALFTGNSVIFEIKDKFLAYVF